MAKLKVCGMTNLDDCLAAVDLGVDYIGFIFYRKSKRYVEPARVREITEKVRGRIKTVGIFVEETEEEVKKLCGFAGLDLAQVYKPMNIPNRVSVARVKDSVPAVEPDGLVLFDRHTEAFGGSGMSFDFELIKGHEALPRAFIAGGIDEKNLFRALDLEPYGIDLASSVEKHAGKKDVLRMKNLVNKMRSYNR
jgi:phosphoribosylanthranilate isomerase